MPYRANYPRTVAEVLDPEMKFNRSALAAVRAFARAKPWRGTQAARWRKFRRVHRTLCRVYGVQPRLTFGGLFACYIPSQNLIVLQKLSVVTYLHEFAHAAFRADERRAVKWSVNLFAKCFPRSFARCSQVGHTLIRES